MEAAAQQTDEQLRTDMAIEVKELRRQAEAAAQSALEAEADRKAKLPAILEAEAKLQRGKELIEKAGHIMGRPGKEVSPRRSTTDMPEPWQIRLGKIDSKIDGHDHAHAVPPPPPPPDPMM